MKFTSFYQFKFNLQLKTFYKHEFTTQCQANGHMASRLRVLQITVKQMDI